ncbi:MAG: hypothetical protein SAL70_05310 [Scytonema sp. PMC 1070.18]|nr:hypothetical protein [Scytonema sp. PMC 1070.18]
MNVKIPLREKKSLPLNAKCGLSRADIKEIMGKFLIDVYLGRKQVGYEL